MAIRFYLQPDTDDIVEWHLVPFYGTNRPFNYLQLDETQAASYDFLQYEFFNPGQENYPVNFLCRGTGTPNVYRKSCFITKGTDLYDALGTNRIPDGVWTLLGYFLDDAAIPDVEWYFKVEVHKRTPDPSPYPSPSPSEDIEVKLFEWTTSQQTMGSGSFTSYSPEQAFHAIEPTDKLVIKIFTYRGTGAGDNLKLRIGTTGTPFHSYIELPEPTSPSPSPETDWADDGNLLAPVSAPVQLNNNHTMYSATGSDPKYMLDNDPNTYWESDSAVDRSVYFNLGDHVQVDAFAFFVHNHNAGLGGLKGWKLSYSTDDSSYTTFDTKLFVDSRSAGAPLIAFKFENPVSARYWKLELIDFDETPVGPVAEIGGVWFMRDYSLPYDNQFPENINREWGNRIMTARSGSSYSSRKHLGHVLTMGKKYVFVRASDSSLLKDAYKASLGGLLPIAMKPDYDSVDWILCRFVSKHVSNETWSEVYQPHVDIQEIGFKRIEYTDHTLPTLSTTVGQWKFVSSLVDASGNGLTLTAVDVPGGVSYDFGICDHEKTCAVFDSDGLLNLASGGATSLDMADSDFSLELILATDTVLENTTLIHKVYAGTGGYFILITTAGKLDVYVGDVSGGVYGYGYGSSIDNGNFHYIVMTVDRTNDLLKMYIDSIQVGANLDISAVTGDISNSGAAFQLGRNNPSADPKQIIGPLDEVCVSKQLLTLAQIQSRWAGFANDGTWRM